jgi:transcription elongation factor Elf1
MSAADAPTVRKKEDRRRSMCPSCQVTRGNVVTITLKADVHTTTLACPSCGHRWERVTRPRKTELLR